MIETFRFGIFYLDPALQGVSVVNKLAQLVRVFCGKKSRGVKIAHLPLSIMAS